MHLQDKSLPIMKRSAYLLLAALLLTTGCKVSTQDGRTLIGGNSTASSTPAQQATPGPNSNTTDFSSEPFGPEENLPESNMYEIVVEDFGVLLIRLYDETPLHRDNFKRLAAENFYDGTTFHRVIENFMIQGGDPNSRDGDRSNDGLGGPNHTLRPEFRVKLHHKRGALAAARKPDQMNPDRRSNGSQFYIVHGRVFEEQELRSLETSMKKRVSTGTFTFTDEAIADYTTLGGAPHLDRQYTVFGELVRGFDVLDEIASLESDSQNNPLRSVSMTIRPAAAQ